MNDKSQIRPVTAEELSEINHALAARFGRHLQPGEGISMYGERSAQHVIASLIVKANDDTFQLEMEAAVLPDDEHKQHASHDAMFDAAADFLAAMLTEFFDNERNHRFHDDWRVYEFDDLMVRFRGQATNPSLEALADAWLAEHDLDDVQ